MKPFYQMFYQVDVFKQLKDHIPDDKVLVPGTVSIYECAKITSKLLLFANFVLNQQHLIINN